MYPLVGKQWKYRTKSLTYDKYMHMHASKQDGECNWQQTELEHEKITHFHCNVEITQKLKWTGQLGSVV